MSKYISLENLTRYDSKIQEYLASFCASRQDGMWRQTEKAGAVAFWPVGNSPLEGTVEFKFKETPPASGDKSPSNPSTITGVSSMKVARCGKNIIRAHTTGSQTISGVTFTVGEDGSVTANGTASANAVFYYAPSGAKVQFKAGCQYTLSGCPAGGSNNTYYIRDSVLQISDFGNSATATASGDVVASVRIVVMSGTTVSNLVFKPQLELGSTATTFEPYSGTDFTLSLGGTYYGGSIDLATGLMTVTWSANVFNGTENWELDSASTETVNIMRLTGSPLASMSVSLNNKARICSHFPFSTVSLLAGTFSTWQTNPRLYIRIAVSDSADVAAFKTWLATQYANGTPVVLAYELGSPQTVQLSPLSLRSLVQPDKYVPRLNTVYSDAENVQIVYQKNPVRDKFEKVSAIVAQGGNV